MVRNQMRRLVLGTTFALASVAAAAVSFAPAFASGGADSGGSGGGGGGGGGGSSTTLTPSAQISSFSVPTGKYGSWAAIWANWTVKNTGPTEFITVQIEEINQATGATDWSRTWTGYLGTNSSASNVFDNDFAPWNTTYLVKFTVIETSTGTVLAAAQAYASTGTQKI
jgi:hypothetical protein